MKVFKKKSDVAEISVKIRIHMKLQLLKIFNMFRNVNLKLNKFSCLSVKYLLLGFKFEIQSMVSASQKSYDTKCYLYD